MRKNGGKTKRLLPFFLGLIVVAAALVFLFSKILIINKLSIKLDNINCVNRTDIENNLNILGKNVLLINSREIEKTLMDKFICIKNVSISKKLPNTVILEILPRVPVVSLSLLPVEEASPSTIDISQTVATPSANLVSYFVDEEGVIFSNSSGENNIPHLYIKRDDLKLSSKIDGDVVRKTINILEKIRGFGVAVADGEISPQEIFVINNFSGKPKIIFDLKKAINEQLASLQLILAKSKIDEEKVESIDLRFENPIVKYAPRK